jgi:hypothetical protein
MTPNNPEPTGQWVSFQCHFCRAHLRIKEAYANLRGRCPECGVRIEAPRSQPTGTLPPRAGDDLGGLIPIDDEWPEPAQVEGGDDGRPAYDIAAGPPAPPPVVPELVPPGEAYGLARGAPQAIPRQPLPEPTHTPYAALPPEGALLPRAIPVGGTSGLEGVKADNDIPREPPPPPPAYPLFQGLYTFPWRPANLFVWLFLALDFSIVTGLISVMVFLWEAGGLAQVGIPLLAPVACVAFIWIGIYASNCLLAVVEETASGNDRVSWPEGANIIEGIGKLLYLLWLLACCSIPMLAVWQSGVSISASAWWQRDPWWVLIAVPWVILFPLLFLSSLAANSRWALLHSKILLGLVWKPQVLLLIWVVPLALVGLCLYLGSRLFVRPNLWLAAGIGLAWSAALLIYGRLLGRAGWMLTHQDAEEADAAARRLHPDESAEDMDEPEEEQEPSPGPAGVG